MKKQFQGLLLIGGILFSFASAFAEEALIYYGALNSEENHSQARQTLETAIEAQGIPLLDSTGKYQPYPEDYYYWRLIVDISGRQDAYAALRAAFHQKDLFGFTISVQKIEFYLMGHTLVGWDHSGAVTLRSSNFDIQSFNSLSDADTYADEKSALFENLFWTEFLDYVRRVNPALADLLREKKGNFRQMLLAHAITMHLGDGGRISYRVSRFYKSMDSSANPNEMRSGLFK